MDYKDLNWPGGYTITSRSSTIRSQFIRAIIPNIKPTDEEVRGCLKLLEQDPEELHCSYCGITATEWDHFRPLVEKKTTTGYVTDIYNLVPTCGKCNQSKSGRHWKVWITGKARYAPAINAALDRRIQILERFERWSTKRTHRLTDLARNDQELSEYMKSCEDLVNSFAAYQRTAERIKKRLEEQV